MDEQKMIQGNDIADFLKGMVSFALKIIRYIFFSLKKYFVIALIIFLSLTSLGLFYFYMPGQVPVYESEMACLQNNLGHFAYGQMIYKLELLIKSKSYRTLANVLGMPEDEARYIRSITATNISGSPLKDDFTQDKSPMLIKVSTSNAAVFTQLQTALLNYLNKSSPYQLLRNGIELKVAAKKAEYLNRDVSLIDSILVGYKAFLTNAGPSLDSTGFSDISALLAYKDKLEDRAIAAVETSPNLLQHTVEVYYGFVPPENPARPQNKSLLSIIIGAFFVSCIVCVLIRLLRSA